MADKKSQEAETGPETAQAEPPVPTVDSTVPPPEAVASGPSLQLQHEGQDLANIRIETVHVAGEPCGIDKVDAKALKGEQGNVCIVATGVSNYGGADILSEAVGSRGRMELELVHNDGESKPVKGDFVVSRMSPAGLFNGEQTYNVVLENAGPAPAKEESDSE